MPTWLIQLGAAAAVIYITDLLTKRFLKQLKDLGDSRDDERKEFAKQIETKEQMWAEGAVI